MMALAMTKRLEAKVVQNATNSSGFEGIMNTLTACSTQSSEFLWTPYHRSVEDKLRTSIPNYHYSPDYTRLTLAVFLGAMDFFYLSQRLPEDSKVTISSETGCIPLIIWVNVILGLTVAVTGFPKGNIIFGDSEEVQVFIVWSQEDFGQHYRERFEASDAANRPLLRSLRARLCCFASKKLGTGY